MSEESKPAESADPQGKQDEQTERAREVASSPEEAESVAEAPGPITPEHESGSWEQTLAERERREDAEGTRREGAD